MSKTLWIMTGSLIVLAVLIGMLAGGPRGSRSSPMRPDGKVSQIELSLFCAASNQAVIEEIRQQYEAETGRRIQIQYGPSQTLLSQMEVTGEGDLYLPADDSFLEMAKSKSMIAEVLPIASMQVVLAVRTGNPRDITDLSDLLADGIQLVQANPDAAAVAKLTRQVLQASGDWQPLHDATAAYRTSVTDVANDVVVGAADAGIVYDAVLHPYPNLQAIRLPELSDAISRVAIGVSSSTKNPAAALHFARYVTAADRGLQRYADHGFAVGAGDAWADQPELTIFAGSMLRPAIEETIADFQQREGVNVSRVYNGCGILVSQMKSGQRPDAYFACDYEFMKQVSDIFPESVAVSQNELVILVHKGNPRGIKSLRDLARDGLRVGIGHEKQCAMGWITQNVLDASGMTQQVMPNVTVQTPTGDMLVNQLRAGSLDAAVVYLSNAAGSAAILDAVQIQGIDCATATQPWAVAKQSKFPQLAGRLFQAICSADSQQLFAAEGFRWQLGQQPVAAVRTENPRITGESQ